MAKRCFLVVGPESAGNRLTAAVLVRAGCIGKASTDQDWDNSLPDNESPAVVICSFPHGGRWPDMIEIYRTLCARGYHVTALVTTREIGAISSSQIKRGHSDSASVDIRIRTAYMRIFHGLRVMEDFVFVPYEVFALHPTDAARSLLKRLGLPLVVDGPVVVDGVSAEITNENRKYYVDVLG